MAGKDAESLAREAADRVREIVASARRRAEEIVGEAEAEAQRIRSRAEADARERLDQVRSALDELQGRLSGKGGAEVEPGPVTVPEPEPPMTPEPSPEPVPEPRPEPVPEPRPEPVPEPTPPGPGREPERGPAPTESASTGRPSTEELIERIKAGRGVGQPGPPPAEANAAGEDEAQGGDVAARLVAMKLALEGTPRDEARERLAADFDVADLSALLDDVYAKARR